MTSSGAQLISLAEASKLTGYNQDYLGQLARAGKFYATKIGRNWATTKKAVESLLAEDSAGDNIESEEPQLSTPKPFQPAAEASGPKISIDGLSHRRQQSVIVNELPITLVEKSPGPVHSNLSEVRKRVEHIRLKEELKNLTQSIEQSPARKNWSLPKLAGATALLLVAGILGWQLQKNFSVTQKLGGVTELTTVKYVQPEFNNQAVLSATDLASVESQDVPMSDDQIILEKNRAGQAVLDLKMIDDRIRSQLEHEKDQDQGSWVQYIPVYFE